MASKLHRGPLVVHHRSERVSHRIVQGGRPRLAGRAAGRGPDDCRAAEAARLRHGAVRQEPSRRPQRIPAHRARLRRVLRQSLSPERRGGTRAARLSARSDFPEFKKRFGPRGVIHCWATDKDDPTDEPRWGRVGKQKIEDTGPLPRSAWRRATTSSSPRPRTSSSASTSADKPFFVWVNTTHMHCGPTPSRRVSGRRAAGSRRTTTR